MTSSAKIENSAALIMLSLENLTCITLMHNRNNAGETTTTTDHQHDDNTTKNNDSNDGNFNYLIATLITRMMTLMVTIT